MVSLDITVLGLYLVQTSMLAQLCWLAHWGCAAMAPSSPSPISAPFCYPFLSLSHSPSLQGRSGSSSVFVPLLAIQINNNMPSLWILSTNQEYISIQTVKKTAFFMHCTLRDFKQRSPFSLLLFPTLCCHKIMIYEGKSKTAQH